MPYKYTRYAKRQRRKIKRSKKHESLLTHMLEMAYQIFFKFGKQSTLVGGHFLSNFGINQSN